MANALQLRAWSDRNLLAGFEVLARHPPAGPVIPPRSFGPIVAFASGRRAGFFNPIVVLEPPELRWLEAAVAWMREKGTPFSLRIREDLEDADLRATAMDLGLVREPWVEPGLAMHPLAVAPPLPAGLTIEPADPVALDRWYGANAAGFGIPQPAVDLVRELTPPDVVLDPDVVLLGGYLNGQPVACSIGIRSDDVVGVYAVGTAEHARRRGIGSAMTWAVIDAGRAWGCRTAVLQASEMGLPVYRSMGFEIATGYITYEEPKRP